MTAIGQEQTFNHFCQIVENAKHQFYLSPSSLTSEKA